MSSWSPIEWEKKAIPFFEKLDEVVQDYNRVRNALGLSAVDKLLKNVKEKVRMNAEAEKEKRKLQRKNSRDVR